MLLGPPLLSPYFDTLSSLFELDALSSLTDMLNRSVVEGRDGMVYCQSSSEQWIPIICCNNFSICCTKSGFLLHRCDDVLHPIFILLQ